MMGDATKNCYFIGSKMKIIKKEEMVSKRSYATNGRLSNSGDDNLLQQAGLDQSLMSYTLNGIK